MARRSKERKSRKNLNWKVEKNDQDGDLRRETVGYDLKDRVAVFSDFKSWLKEGSRKVLNCRF